MPKWVKDGNIKVKGYNEIADYCYSKLKQKDIIEIEGFLNDKIEVVLNNIEIIKK